MTRRGVYTLRHREFFGYSLLMATTKTTARIDHSALGKGVCCEHCGYATQVSKRRVVTHALNGRRECPTN